LSENARPPFRADHVGSLLRPQAVLQAREEYKAGRIGQERLHEAEDAAIRDVVKLQEELGFQVATDGELRRESFLIDFYREISGLREEVVLQPWNRDKGSVAFQMTGFTIDDKLSLDKTIFGDDFAFLRSVTRVTPKITIPAPSILHRRWGKSLVGSKIYPDIEEYWADLAEVYADELDRLATLGCTYVQLDDTSFATLCDPKHRVAAAELVDDPDSLHLKYIRLINESVKRKPEGMRVTVHTCRGNHRSSWFASGAYDFVAEALFSELNVDGFFLEYDDERSGGFEPLRYLSNGKMAVLGLVSTKRPELESKDSLKRRIDEAAKYLPLDQLCLSPQCGFASTVEGNLITADDQTAKLRLVVETAREVWN
jgi:5-methyltetrahydropteroyltriglutamate--homocysteine methyltransferase